MAARLAWQRRAGVGRFNLVLDHVRERRLDDIARVVRLLGGPIPERRPEAMRDSGDTAPFEQPPQLLDIQPPAAPAGEDERAVAERPHFSSQLYLSMRVSMSMSQTPRRA